MTVNDVQSGPRGTIFDIKRYAIHDGPGIRTTVFFKGCPLRCRWCHNPESLYRQPEPAWREGRCVRCGNCAGSCPAEAISINGGGANTDLNKCTLCAECIEQCTVYAREIIGREWGVMELVREIEKDVIFFDQSDGGVTFSGGEALMQPEFLKAVLQECRKRDIHTVVDTTCYARRDVLAGVAEYVDLFLCDLKHMDTEIHREQTGVDNALILDNVRYLDERGQRMVIRIPVIPGFNTDREQMAALADFARSLRHVDRVDLLPCNYYGVEKMARLSHDHDIVKIEPPGQEFVDTIANIFKDYNLEVTTGG